MEGKNTSIPGRGELLVPSTWKTNLIFSSSDKKCSDACAVIVLESLAGTKTVDESSSKTSTARDFRHAIDSPRYILKSETISRSDWSSRSEQPMRMMLMNFPKFPTNFLSDETPSFS